MPYKQFILRDNPVAFYKQDEASGVACLDSSDNAKDATFVGAPTLAQASMFVDGTAVLYNGTTQYATVDSALPLLVNTFAIHAAITMSSALGELEERVIFDYDNQFKLMAYKEGAAEGIYIFLPGVHTNIYDGPHIPIANIALGTDYYITAVYDLEYLKIYLNSVLVQSIAVSSALSTPGAVNHVIGASTALSDFWHGKLDEIAIFSAPLALDEIRLHYKTGLGYTYFEATIFNTEPLSYFSCNENSGVVLADTMGGNAIDVISTPDLTVAGLFGSGVKLNTGSADYLDLGNRLGVDSSGDKSFVFWIKPDAIGANEYIITNRSVGSNGFSILLNSDGTVGISWGNTENTIQTVSTILTDQLTCVVCVFDGINGGAIYFNGALSVSGALGTEQTYLNKIRVGGQWLTDNAGSDSSYGGLIDEIVVYDKAITDVEVAKLFYIATLNTYQDHVASFLPYLFFPFSEVSGNIAQSLGAETIFSPSGTVNYSVTPAVINGDNAIDINIGYFERSATPVTYLSSDSVTNGDWTFVSWIKPLDTAAAWLFYFTDAVSNEVGFYLSASAILGYYHKGLAVVESTATVTINEWNHIAYTHNANGDIRIYINGGLANAFLGHDTTSFNGASNYARIGEMDGHCGLDDMAFFHHELSAGDVASLYNIGKNGFGFYSGILGVTYDVNKNPLECIVSAHHAETEELWAKTTSNITTGKYALVIENSSQEHVFVDMRAKDNIHIRPLSHGPILPTLF
ncbi:MAG: LamG domain-containing protein [Thiomargarita sp.]|nr:LamG domain-containing protein [Thiomargarita sp.]